MNEVTIITEQATTLITELGDKFFTVTFTKKNGEERVLNGRRGVVKYTNGEGMKYVPSDYDLLTVYDVQAEGYRMISCNTISALRIGGVDYIVEKGA